MTELSGKVALVTGGGRGIGRASALELVKLGATVAVSARSAAEVQAVAAEIQRLGGKALALTADLADPQSSQRVVEQVISEFGSIDILINNAALAGPFGLTWELEPEQWARAIEVNLVAPFRLACLVIPAMQAKGWGRIINVSSGAARNPMERAGPYSVSKAGIDMLTRQIGLELEGSGVVTISLYPGIVDTEMQTTIRTLPKEVVGEATHERFQNFHRSGQLLSPEVPGRLIALLSGSAGAKFNGQIITVQDEVAQDLLKLE